MFTQRLQRPGANSRFTRRPGALVQVAGVAALVLLASCGGGGGGEAPADVIANDATQSALRAEVDLRRVEDSLASKLKEHGFTGAMASTLELRLGRKLDPKLADLGRMLFFDTFGALHDDNACAGCHSPSAGMGDTQSIAIGIQNNGKVGPGRTGPRNQRRSPMVINTPFLYKLMWNGRFNSLSEDPFDNSMGFEFTPPEGRTRFPANDPIVKQLLIAHAHMPLTEIVEVAGFRGITDLGDRFLQFDDGLGSLVPPPDASGFRNEPIRQAVLVRLNGNAAYRALFGASFPEVAAGAPIDFTMFGRAIAEFEFTLVRANAPLDRFARGERHAMSPSEKRGAQIFFGKGKCVQCHAVAGKSNEMFTDLTNRNIGVPQIAPEFGVGKGNMIFDGPGEDEDFGAAQVSGLVADRYKFRTSPLRNVALQPAFFHNGAFTRLEDAIRHHLDVAKSARSYDARRAGIDRDLRNRLGPIEPVLATLDPLLRDPIQLHGGEFEDLVAFVRNGLLDPGAKPVALCPLIPRAVPSARALLTFEGCRTQR